MESASNFCTVFVSTSTFENARNISRILVSEKIAACCTIVPHTYSIYAWKGSIEENSEAFLIIKTSKDKLQALESRVTELHPYDVPEIIALTLDQAAAPYLGWMQSLIAEDKAG